MRSHLSEAFHIWNSKGQNMTDQSSAAISGTVDTIIKSPLPNESDKVQITVEGADHPYEQIRIQNTLTDKNGDKVQLKPGAKVQVTVRTRAADNLCTK
jgi:archaellum component FlaG (FlaF/FlaG flagellin family)